jgi:hypothetical protein
MNRALGSRRRKRVAGVALALGGVIAWALISHCCSDRRSTTRAVAPTVTAGAESPAARSPGATTSPRATTSSPTTPAADNAVARMMRSTDAADRTLLADIERETHAEPSQEIRALMSLQRQGADRTTLERFIEEKLASKLAVRVAVERWLRAKLAHGPGAPTSAVLPDTLGSGGGMRRVSPVVGERQSDTP